MGADGIFPENWKEVIRGKKVILYNTGVTCLLNEREKRIKKMKWVFQIFKEHPEVVLWWRPHPLELCTLQSMVPELEAQYREVRQWYVEENIGILDDSVDFNRAIAISDAYYGTWSSVVELYRVAGKPILYENNNILEQRKELVFDVTDFELVDRTVWFISSTMNVLFAMDLDTFELEEIIKIPYGNVLGKDMLCNIIHVGDYFVLVPRYGKWIVRFNMNERKFEKLKVRNYGDPIRFATYVVYNECIYILPAFENRVVKYDVIRNEMVCEIEMRRIRNDWFLETDIEVMDSYIYALEEGGNHIYKYDMQNDTYEKIQVLSEDKQLCGIKRVKNLFLLVLANDNEIFLWDEKKNKTWKLEKCPEEYSVQNRPFCDFVRYKESIFFFPEQSDRTYRFNVEQMVLESYKEIEEKGDDRENFYFKKAKNIGEAILAYDHWHNQWIVVHPEKGIVSKHKMIVRGKALDEVTSYSIFEMDEGFDKLKKLWEEDRDFYSLHNYIGELAVRDVAEQSIENRDSIGEKIHRENAY